MSDDRKLSNRIPHESLGETAQVKGWALPSMQKKSRIFMSARRETAESTDTNSTSEEIEDYRGPVKPKPLTAQQLQALTESAKQEGYATGYEEGFAKGLSDGQREGEKKGRDEAFAKTETLRESEIRALEKISATLISPMNDRLDCIENTLVEMAFSLAKHLVADEISLRPQLLLAVIRRALASLPVNASNVQVFLHPEDITLVDDVLPPYAREWKMQPESALDRGGCRVETRESQLDASLSTRLRDYLDHARRHPEAAMSSETLASSTSEDLPLSASDDSGSVEKDD